jgi:hypothetical protein
MMDRFLGSWPYKLLVFTVVMPVNGILINRGDVSLGIALAVVQIPWFVYYCILKHDL